MHVLLRAVHKIKDANTTGANRLSSVASHTASATDESGSLSIIEINNPLKTCHRVDNPDASVGPYTLFIFANSSFPAEELVEVESVGYENSTIYSTLPTEIILTQSSVALTIQEPLTWVDKISDFWTKVGSPISFIYGILAGISPWFYGRMRARVKNNDKKKKTTTID